MRSGIRKTVGRSCWRPPRRGRQRASRSAVALLHDVLSLGGEDAGFARYSLAELSFEQGRDAEAWEHLRALEEEDCPPDAGASGLVAELLEERGEDEAALQWFNRAIGALGADEVAVVGEPGGTPSLHANLFFGRQRIRRRLGLPTDEWDRVGHVAEQNRLDFARLLERAAKASKRPTSAGATTLVWQREEQQLAARQWPSVFPPEIIGHHPQVEQRLHECVKPAELGGGAGDEPVHIRTRPHITDERDRAGARLCQLTGGVSGSVGGRRPRRRRPRRPRRTHARSRGRCLRHHRRSPRCSCHSVVERSWSRTDCAKHSAQRGPALDRRAPRPTV